MNEIPKGSFQLCNIVQNEAMTTQLLLLCCSTHGPSRCWLLTRLPSLLARSPKLSTMTRSWTDKRTWLESSSRRYFSPKQGRCGIAAQQTETVAMSVTLSQNLIGDKAYVATSRESRLLRFDLFRLNSVSSVQNSLRSTFTTLRRSFHNASPGLSSTISFFIRYTEPVPMAVVSPESYTQEHFQIFLFNSMR